MSGIMESSEETATLETGGRRTRSGRCSMPMPARTPTRKTRKKMVLVEVEVSDEEDGEIVGMTAMAAKHAKAESVGEIAIEADSEVKSKPEETRASRVDSVEVKTGESTVEKRKADAKTRKVEKRMSKCLDDVEVEIVENDINFEIPKSESLLEDTVTAKGDTTKNGGSIPVSNTEALLHDKTESSNLEYYPCIDTSSETDRYNLEVGTSTNNEVQKEENGIVEDVDDILDSVVSDLSESYKITEVTEAHDVESKGAANLEEEDEEEEPDDKYEVTEPMDIDESEEAFIQDNQVDIEDVSAKPAPHSPLITESNVELTVADRANTDIIDNEDLSNQDVQMTEDKIIEDWAESDITESTANTEEVRTAVCEQKSADDEQEDESLDIKARSVDDANESDSQGEVTFNKHDSTDKQIIPADPDAENISEDELPTVQVAKVPETEEVSDEELPGPKRAELPADTEVVSEDELPAVKKEGTKRKIAEGDYDPGSPTSENEVSPKKPFLELDAEKEKEKLEKPKKLPELDKYWKAVNDDPTDFTGWTYLLQYVDQENDMEAAREAYDAFLSHYPYCYGYWRKYADYEKRKGNKKKCEEVFERGLKAIPLSVDLWIHYLTYVRTTKADEEDFIRSQFERALNACGLEFRSDRLWDSYIKWETDGKRLQHATAIYDKLLTTPTQGYTTHFDNFQEHVTSNPPNKILEVDEFLALRKEVKHMLKHDVTTEPADNPDVPPGEDSEETSSDEETKAIRERIISIRRKIHKNTVTAVTGRWNFEEGIKRPYFHVKPLERCQLKNWQEYLDYEVAQGDQTRIIVLFERCLIACALYEEFWLRFVHYLEGLKDPELFAKIKDVYERACTIHHIKKPNLHLQWAMFEESIKNFTKAAEILVNLEKSVPNILQVAYRRINLERRREDYEKCSQLYEHYITNAKNKLISTNLSIKYARFCLKILKNADKAVEVLNAALTKDTNNPRLYLQLIDITMQKETVNESEVMGYLDVFLEKENFDIDQKVLFAQRKLEFLEDFGSDIQAVQKAYDEYQKYIKTSKDTKKKEPAKGDLISKKEKNPPLPSSQTNSYANYGSYGNSSNAANAYQYSGSQQGQYNYSQYGQNEQYQYGNWQYPQSGYSGYNQWSGYGGGYGY